MKTLYGILGLLFVGLGLLGAFLPLLPTTPFLLLAVWCFTRSWTRLERWLLENRLFGRYLSDFHNGRGVPLRVKIYTLAMLWGVMTFTAVWVINPLWLKALLFFIAVAVSIHILHLKTKREVRRIIVLVPTSQEAALFERGLKGVDVVISGVGMAETAAATAEVLRRGVNCHGRRQNENCHRHGQGHGQHGHKHGYEHEHGHGHGHGHWHGHKHGHGNWHHNGRRRLDMVILAGSAGAYPGSGLAPGDCVIVRSETVADLGAIREEDFKPLYQKTYTSPWAHQITDIPQAEGRTVNCAGTYNYNNRCTPTLLMTDNIALPPTIENMEGAAFFAVCRRVGIPFLELRAVSNLTTDPRDDWQLDRAAEALAKTIKTLIINIQTQKYGHFDTPRRSGKDNREHDCEHEHDREQKRDFGDNHEHDC